MTNIQAFFVGQAAADLEALIKLSLNDENYMDELNGLLEDLEFRQRASEEHVVREEEACLADCIAAVEQSYDVRGVRPLGPTIKLQPDRVNKILVYSAADNQYSRIPHLNALQHAFHNYASTEEDSPVAAMIIPHQDTLIDLYKRNSGTQERIQPPCHIDRAHWNDHGLPDWAWVYTPAPEDFWAAVHEQPRHRKALVGVDKLASQFLSKLKRTAKRGCFTIDIVPVFAPHHLGFEETKQEINRSRRYGFLENAIVSNVGFGPSWLNYTLPESMFRDNGNGPFYFIDSHENDGGVVTNRWGYDRKHGYTRIRFLHSNVMVAMSDRDIQVRRALFPANPAQGDMDVDMS